MISLNMTTASRVGFNLLAILGVIIALRLGMSIFIPLVIAVLLAAMLWPAVVWLHRWRIRWGMACMLVVGALVVVNLIVTFNFILAVPRMLQGLPNPRDEIGQQQLYADFRAQLQKFSPVPLDEEYLPADANRSRVFQYIKETLQGPYVTNLLLTFAYYANNWIWHGILILFILLFLLLEGPMLSRRVVEIFGPGPESRAKAVGALADMARQVRVYLVWRTIINFGLGAVVGVVYYSFGLRQAGTWALLTAVLCYIPYLGPIAAGIPPLLDAFFSCPSPWYVLAVLVFYIAIITVEGYVLVPVAMGRSMELNATTVMLACLFWDLVWGTPGLFLAMPLMAAVKAVCYHVPGWRPWANLMSTNETDLDTETEQAARAGLLEDTQLLPAEDASQLRAAAESVTKEG